MELIDVVEELDASGGDGSRPLWNRCIDRIETGEADALCVWNLDRFSRSIVDGFRAILGPTEALSRLIFAAPTQYYKVGVKSDGTLTAIALTAYGTAGVSPPAGVNR